MPSLTIHLPAEPERARDAAMAAVQPPANGFMHDGKLNMGPAIALASVLSAGCWAIIIGVGIKLFH